MAIRTASAERDFLGIRKIWEERFTSDQTYLDTIFNEVFPLCRSYVHIGDNNEVLSVIALMPMRFYSPETETPLRGFYLFGVATLEKATGRHLAENLILHANRELTTEGYDFIFERPANQSLNKYYIKLGYSISLKKIPHLFNLDKLIGSTKNNHRKPTIKSLAESILNEIKIEFNRRFEWNDTQILEGLLKLDELNEHNKREYSQQTLEEETFIAVNNLSSYKDSIFTGTFFCFTME